MLKHIYRQYLWRSVLLALGLFWLFPGMSEAHAILLRSDPAKDAVLTAAPGQVRMWFSEDLNPTFSTAEVLNGNNQRVDKRDAHVSTNDIREMDISLGSNLPAAVYIVVWRSDSNNDGHILSGSFIFYVANADGSVPTLGNNTITGLGDLGSSNQTGLYTGQLDLPSLFNLIMITLVELGAVFWVGAQIWFILVLLPVTEDHTELREINQGIQERFERLFSPYILAGILLADIGVLVGQALLLTGNQWGAAFAPDLLVRLAANGRFGSFWQMRELVVLLALALSLATLFIKAFARWLNRIRPWLYFILGLALFLAMTMSSHAAAVNTNVVVYAILSDWLHLLASAIWVGGMLFIATTYLPMLKKYSLKEKAGSLVTTLPYYSPWAFAAVLLMAISGTLNTTFHLTSLDQFINTAYGRVLAVKILLVIGLLVTSAIHVFLLRPRLAKEYRKYSYALTRVKTQEPISVSTQPVDTPSLSEPDPQEKLLHQQIKLREQRLTRRTQGLTSVLNWEPLLGVAVLLCVGLLNVFAGTLSPIGTTQQTTTQVKPYTTTVKTTDGKYSVTLTVNPNRFGPNVFTATVVDTSTGTVSTNIGVSLYTTMLDMDMGTDTINLLPDGKGNFTARGDLSMGGHWGIRIQIRTTDNTLHEATITLTTPF